jgi:hypothetical protein
MGSVLVEAWWWFGGRTFHCFHHRGYQKRLGYAAFERLDGSWWKKWRLFSLHTDTLHAHFIRPTAHKLPLSLFYFHFFHQGFENSYDMGFFVVAVPFLSSTVPPPSATLLQSYYSQIESRKLSI